MDNTQSVSWENKLQVVGNELRALSLALPAGIDSDGLSRLRAALQDKLGASLPDFFAGFLQKSDGLTWNGVTLYGSQARQYPELPIPELIAENIAVRQHPTRPIRSGTFIGHDELSAFFVDESDGRVHSLDKTTLVEHGSARSGEDFLVAVLSVDDGDGADG